MKNSEIKRQKKLKKLLDITNIDEKQLAKLNYKEKQQYFKAKSQLCHVAFVSKDKNGKGLIYHKPKEVIQSEK